MAARANKLALGTVQFGKDYGIANKDGKVSRDEAAAILDLAWTLGVDTLDTAIAYGESESLLGSVGIDDWKVISKIPAVPADRKDIGAWVRQSVEGSLERLGLAKLHAVLLHSAGELTKVYGKELYTALSQLKNEGIVGKLGLSIYDPSELEAVFGEYDIDIVQAPLNVFDRRLLRSGWLEKLHNNGVEIHVRSVFLQGLLLMQPQSRPAYFKQWESHMALWDNWISDSKKTPLEVCLGFAMQFPEISRIVVGVDNYTHLKQITEAVAGQPAAVPDILASDDIHMINPSFWPAR